MYKIWKYLFGWDYISWDNSADQGIARILKDHKGVVFYWRYKNTRKRDIITDPDQVLWLTCHPTEYLDKIRLANTPPKEIIVGKTGFDIFPEEPKICPHGYKFGDDSDVYDECDKCPIYDECLYKDLNG